MVEEGGKSGKGLKGESVPEGNLWDTEAWCMPDSEGTMPSQSTYVTMSDQDVQPPL